jgi:hypothetical protein
VISGDHSPPSRESGFFTPEENMPARRIALFADEPKKPSLTLSDIAHSFAVVHVSCAATKVDRPDSSGSWAVFKSRLPLCPKALHPK